MMSMIKATTEQPLQVAVIGGGAAGIMSSIIAAENGASVTIFERNDRLGKKLRITGKGRCNVTNDCDVAEFLLSVPTNPKFLYTALNSFSPNDTKAFFENLGVPLKTERGKRVFPVSDKASDIVEALRKRCRELNVSVLYDRVSKISKTDDGTFVVNAGNISHSAKAVILCTGGKSYPLTGSDGDGYNFARGFSHTITELSPSLVPIVSPSKICRDLQGLSLKNIELKIVNKNSQKTVYSDFGEMMFTHFGITGPLVLSASAHISDIKSGEYEVHIDLKPALDEKKLDLRLISDFTKLANRDFSNSLSALLPQKMIAPFASLTGIDFAKKVNSITKEERAKIISLLKRFKFPINGFRPIEEAIITKGGVDVKEINPTTMQSRLCENLYFAGEIIDVDAYTGGFNLQIAFSSAYVAGKNAALNTKTEIGELL